MTINEGANKLLEGGLSVIPIMMPGKNPGVKTWKDYQDRAPELGELDYVQGAAIICGAVSGGVECLDIDLKYDLFKDDKENNIIARLRDAMGEPWWSEIQNTVVIQRTVNGGIHFIYRCEKIGPNDHFAFRYATPEELVSEPKNFTKCLIESRGQGGYFAAEPTPGYSVIHGDLRHIPVISVDLRDRLITAAKMCNLVWDEDHQAIQKEEKVMMESTGGDRSWEAYDEQVEIPDLLYAQGWKLIKTIGPQQYWKRPGSTDSKWSATYHSEWRIFYLFSSSVGLEANRGYRAYQLTTFWEYNGDFKLASRAFWDQGYRKSSAQTNIQNNLPAVHQNGQSAPNSQPSAAPVQHHKEKQAPKTVVYTLEEIQLIWKDILVDTEPEPEVVLLEINGVPIATANNHSLIIGKKKTRKSLYITLLLSEYKGNLEKDVLLFDTEQGRHHVWKNRLKIFQKTGKWIPIFYLRGQNWTERRASVEATIKYWPSRAKIIVIDGIRDLMSNINDPDQTTDLIHWLERMTLEHGLHIINVLHINKTDNNARGHLGSELLNKAEMTTELQKDEMSGATIVKCESSRGKPFEDFAFTHGYDEQPEVVGMPTKGEIMPDRERSERLEACFDGMPLKYADMIEAIKANFEVGRDRARRLLAEFLRSGKIIKSGTDGRGNQNTIYKLL